MQHEYAWDPRSCAGLVCEYPAYRAARVTAAEELRQYIGARGEELEVSGPVRLLGYNSPFVPWFMRVAAVQTPVREKRSG